MDDYINSNNIAAASAVIAFCALGLTLWQGYIARRHNIMSVAPLLNSCIVCHVNDPFKIEISNGGLGPAIIKKFTIYVNDSEFDIGEENLWERILTLIGVDVNSVKWVGQSHIEGDPIQAGKSALLLEIKPVNDIEGTINHLDRVHDLIKYSIEYECMYGKKRTLRK